MISNKFYYILIIRIILISLSGMSTGYFFITENYITVGFIVFFIAIQSLLLLKLFNRNNRKVAYFFKALLNDDFTLNFHNTNSISSTKELDASLNQLNAKFQNTHLHNQTQEKYYQELIKQAEIGVLTINTKGHILFANPKSEKLLNRKPLTHVNQLNEISTELHSLVCSTLDFERKLIQLTNERESFQLAIKANTIQLSDKKLKLITLQDINSELDTKETDSWIKLIRVLTHEIMNSIAPITSISESLLKQHQNIINGKTKVNTQSSEVMLKGLSIIKSQGDDLIRFVQSYRSFLSVPKPEKKIININSLFEKIQLLFDKQLNSNNIDFFIDTSAKIEIFADEQQFTQVLLNLVKNAIQSLEKTSDPKIIVTAFINKDSKKEITITDNGIGISNEEMERIFVPFFTTKVNGSGVGLSISKQIIQLHNGQLKVKSTKREGTTFSIIL